MVTGSQTLQGSRFLSDLVLVNIEMRTDVVFAGLLQDQVRRPPPIPSASVSSLALAAVAGIVGGLIGAVVDTAEEKVEPGQP